MSKLTKTVICVEVLSEGPYDSDDLQQVAYDITDGECSGAVRVVSSQELTPKQMAAALIAQGSDPEFFGLDEHGNRVH